RNGMPRTRATTRVTVRGRGRSCVIPVLSRYEEGRPAGRPPCDNVGVTGFEPAASSSRTKRATKLRHTPLQPFESTVKPRLRPIEPACSSLACRQRQQRGLRAAREAHGGVDRVPAARADVQGDAAPAVRPRAETL